MVAGVFCLYCSTYIRYIHPLGMADAHSPLSNHGLCKGNGYHVRIHTC